MTRYLLPADHEILSSDFVVIILIFDVWVPRRSKTVEQMTLDLLQNCDVPEEVSITFNPEIDLDDDTVGRSHYERFYSVLFAVIRREKI